MAGRGTAEGRLGDIAPARVAEEEAFLHDFDGRHVAEDRTLHRLTVEDPALPTIANPSGRAVPPPNSACLDGLRGIACLMVYLSHQHPHWYHFKPDPLHEGFGYRGNYEPGTLPFVRSLFNGGPAAVAIFFVLSGYVLSVGPMRQIIRDADMPAVRRRLTAAFVRRPFRLYLPVLAVSFGFVLFLHLPFGLAPILEFPQPQETLWLEIVKWVSVTAKFMNPFTAHGNFIGGYLYIPPAWTMPIEYWGSILVYIMVGITTFIPRWRLIFIGVTGFFLFIFHQWEMACFMGGSVLAIVDLDGRDRNLLSRYSKRTTTVALNVLFFFSWFLLGQPANYPGTPELSYETPGWYILTMITPRNYFYADYWRFYNTIAAVLLVYSILRIAWLQNFFLSRPLRFLGRVSFSLYLIHIPWLFVPGDRVLRLLGNKRGEFETWFDDRLPIPDIGPLGFSTGFITAQLLMLPPVLFLSELCTRYVDQPSIRISRAVSARFGFEKAQKA